jgi:hypothetical protein
MTPETQLILGCFGLGLGLAYAWWARVRDDVLVLDLAAILDRLDEKVKARGLSADPLYLHAREFMGLLIRSAPYLAPEIFLCLAPGVTRGNASGDPEMMRPWIERQSGGPIPEGQVSKEVQDALLYMALRIFFHLILRPATWLAVARIGWWYVTGNLRGTNWSIPLEVFWYPGFGRARQLTH